MDPGNNQYHCRGDPGSSPAMNHINEIIGSKPYYFRNNNGRIPKYIASCNNSRIPKCIISRKSNGRPQGPPLQLIMFLSSSMIGVLRIALRRDVGIPPYDIQYTIGFQITMIEIISNSEFRIPHSELFFSLSLRPGETHKGRPENASGVACASASAGHALKLNSAFRIPNFAPH